MMAAEAEMVMPGDRIKMTVELIQPGAIEQGYAVLLFVKVVAPLVLVWFQNREVTALKEQQRQYPQGRNALLLLIPL